MFEGLERISPCSNADEVEWKNLLDIIAKI
jgi:hypothetical protein